MKYLLCLMLPVLLVCGCNDQKDAIRLQAAQAEEHAAAMRLEAVKLEQAQADATAKVRADNKAAILSVLRQFVKILKDENVNPHTKVDYFQRQIAPKFRQIDISSCPTDFKVAWIEWIHAMEDEVRLKKGIAGKEIAALGFALVPGGQGLAATTFGSAVADTEKENPVARAWENVETAVIKARISRNDKL